MQENKNTYFYNGEEREDRRQFPRLATTVDVQYNLIKEYAPKTEVLAKHQHTKARVLRVTTAHGEFVSPVFMPVGTRAGVNNMMPSELQAANSQVILGGNTYHMLCAPGMKVIEASGGVLGLELTHAMERRRAETADRGCKQMEGEEKEHISSSS